MTAHKVTERFAGHVPTRRDIVRRERAPAPGMLRLVVDPDGRLVADLAAKLPGRGIWIAADRAALEQARAKRLFAREAKRQVEVDAALADQIETLLVRRCLDLVGLARRAGQLVLGFDQVRAALASGTGLLVIASDAAGDAHKLRRAARPIGWVAPFTRFELGAQVGRAELVYAHVAAGALADRLQAELSRLKGFREFDMAEPQLAESPSEGMSRAQ